MKQLGLALLLCACCLPALAQSNCRGQESQSPTPATVSVRFDNDLFGGTSQDQGYSNGAVITLVSPSLRDYTEDPCLPRVARWLNGKMVGSRGRAYEQRNMVLAFGQALYTPEDSSRSDLIRNDRPYAAALMVGLGYNLRNGDVLDTTQVRVGVVGPSALGKQVQTQVHRWFGNERFLGWDNQLRDEMVFQLLHQRTWRVSGGSSENALGWDVARYVGGSFGNFATYANAGGEIRWGSNLPDDFGSAPSRLAGDNTAPTSQVRASGLWSWHVFASGEGRWVVRDITLDGNTFEASHRVDKRAWVGDLSYGLVINRGRWKLALAQSRRTREFDGQRMRPVFGSLSISRAL